MKIIDDDTAQIIKNLGILEVSGPPHIVNHSHFVEDEKKTTKALKYILNDVYKKTQKV